jgi:hypothetical protein
MPTLILLASIGTSFMRFEFPYMRAGSGPPRPIIGVNMRGPRSSVYDDGLLDIGSDRVLIPRRIALQVGIDVDALPRSITLRSPLSTG